MARKGSSVIQAMLKRLAEEEAKEQLEQGRAKGSVETAEPARALAASG